MVRSARDAGAARERMAVGSRLQGARPDAGTKTRSYYKEETGGQHGLRREAAPGAPQEDQKRNFNANCNWREEPESATGKRVLVMLEKLAAVENTVAPVGLKGPGWPKLG